jgi:hypothetical protein
VVSYPFDLIEKLLSAPSALELLAYNLLYYLLVRFIYS